MSKIDLLQKRSLGDMITVTFNFIKQEFGPLLRYFAVLCLPLVIIDLILKTTYLNGFLVNTANSLIDSGKHGITSSVIWNMVSTMVLTFWVQLFTLSYLRVYLDKRHKPESERITLAEILQVMTGKLWNCLVCSVCLSFILVIATCFLIVPGVYLGIGLVFTIYYVVLKDQSLAKMFKSLELVRGNWWATFGYIIILTMIVNVISYLFSLPLLISSMVSVFTGAVPGSYQTALLLLLASVGQYALLVVLFVGISMNFFTLIDKQEHISILDKIDRLGTVEEQRVNEGER